MARDINGPPTKQAKITPQILPANIIIQFENDNGESTGNSSPRLLLKIAKQSFILLSFDFRKTSYF